MALSDEHSITHPSSQIRIGNSFDLQEKGDGAFLIESTITDLLEKMRSTAEQPNDVVESLKIQLQHAKRENEKKDVMIQDLLKKIHDALDTIKVQAHQIKELQAKLTGELKDDDSMFKVPLVRVPMPVSDGLTLISSQIELRIITQPPGQAIYQRILRPFPEIAVTGVGNIKGAASSLFVEVCLIVQQQEDHNIHALYQTVPPYGKSNQVDPEKKNLMIGGQLVQRSESRSTADTLIVVFRKLKILTTTAQQGGSFFLLKFVLKRYVDNQFETVPNVAPVISDPIEVFSHTLYLKGRPTSKTPKGTTATTTTNNILLSDPTPNEMQVNGIPLSGHSGYSSSQHHHGESNSASNTTQTGESTYMPQKDPSDSY